MEAPTLNPLAPLGLESAETPPTTSFSQQDRGQAADVTAHIMKSNCIPDEENQIVESVVVTPLPPSKMDRSISLDSGSLLPSPPTTLKRFESDPGAKVEKLGAQELQGSSSSSSKKAINNSTTTRDSRGVWNLNRLSSLSFEKFDANTFFCRVCLENCSVSLGFVISNCSEQHKYCRDCLQGYYTAQVTDGVIEHFCPGVGEGCHGSLSPDELKSLVSGDAFQRNNRLLQVKKNPLYRECPSCNIGVTLADQSPNVKCGSCGMNYCFFHANAHTGMTCEQYARTQSRRTRQDANASNAFMRRNTRQCPYCDSPTEKSGGCNHM
jgi:ribosomal protein S27AE